MAYFFNTETGFCQAFSFSGCGGNGNNYRTLKDCARNCGNNFAFPYFHIQFFVKSKELLWHRRCQGPPEGNGRQLLG